MAQNVYLRQDLNDLVLSGDIDIYFNDVKYEIVNLYESSNIDIIKYEPLTIKLVNNQISNIFDLENMVFNSYYRPTDSYIDYNVTTKEPDLIVYTISSDDTTEWERHITFNFRDGYGGLKPNCITNANVSFIARPTAPTEDYPFIKIYDIDEENIESLNGELALMNDDLLNNGLEPINKYVSSLIRIPYPIESESEPVGIQIANKGFDTTASLVSSYVQNIKLGTIIVEHDVLQGIGYKNIEFKLMIPNFKPIELETEQVMGRTIDIDLAIDLTTGKGTANIKIDGTVQYIESENIGKEIPFKADNININIGSSILETDFINPYLLITVLEPDNSISSELIKQRKIDSLLPINYSYIKTEKPLIHSKATRLEQLEIQRLLRNGVYINEYQ